MTLLTISQRIKANMQHTAIKPNRPNRSCRVIVKKTDDRAQKILDNLQRDRESRIHNHSLILDDLKELGMYGELSEDQSYVTTSFEDLHRLDDHENGKRDSQCV